MIVKSLTRSGSTSSVGYGQAIEYILKTKEPLKKVPSELIFTKNMLGKTNEEWVNELKTLEALRINPRQDNVKLHHYILSLSHLDGKEFPQELYQDIAYKFFELVPPSKYVCAVHLDKDSPQAHWHIIGSGVRLDTLTANRMTREELANLKETLQSFHLEKYYEYTKNSEVKFKNPSLQKISDAEIHLTKQGKQSEKARVKELLLELLEQSISKEQFYTKLQEQGIQTYSRGKNDGVVLESGRHIRFSSLGINEKIAELDMSEQSLLELKTLRESRDIKQHDRTTAPILKDRDIIINFLNPQPSFIEESSPSAIEKEKDENDIEINFYR